MSEGSAPQRRFPGFPAFRLRAKMMLGFLIVLVIMSICYGGVIWCSRALSPRVAVGTIVVVARIRALASNSQPYTVAPRFISFAVTSLASPIPTPSP